MEILIEGWEWLPLEDVGVFGIFYFSVVVAAVIFKVYDKMKAPKE